VYKKWKPKGILVIPRNLGEELNDRRSKPTKVLGGSDRMIRVEVMATVLTEDKRKICGCEICEEQNVTEDLAVID
jgi:hypothetical protein